MKDITNSASPPETDALIDHILARYHNVHLTELSSLHPLAEKVETVHAHDPQAPKGLARALMALWCEMKDHMAKEEMILFPAMRAGSAPGIGYPIAAMRAEHLDHADTIAQIRRLTADMTLPDHACGSWRELYRGISKLLTDLEAHIALENEVLFPRFEQ